MQVYTWSRSIIVAGYLPALRNRTLYSTYVKWNILTGMKYTHEYESRESCTANRTLNWLASSVFFWDIYDSVLADEGGTGCFREWFFELLLRWNNASHFANRGQLRSTDAKDVPKRVPKESPRATILFVTTGLLLCRPSTSSSELPRFYINISVSWEVEIIIDVGISKIRISYLLIYTLLSLDKLMSVRYFENILMQCNYIYNRIKIININIC